MKVLANILTIAIIIYVMITVGTNHPPQSASDWVKFIGIGLLASVVAYVPLLGLSFFVIFMVIAFLDDEGAGCGCLLLILFGMKLLHWLFDAGAYAFSSTSSWFEWLFHYFQ